MEIHQKFIIPVTNTFRKVDFKLHYRPNAEEIELIKKGKELEIPRIPCKFLYISTNILIFML